MKGIQQISSLRNIKSIHSIGARSIPKVQRSSYLELYTLRREKDRLEKEMSVLEKTRISVDRQLISVTRRIERLQKETQEEKNKKAHQTLRAKPVKSIAINY